jgi:hypothetical protein
MSSHRVCALIRSSRGPFQAADTRSCLPPQPHGQLIVTIGLIGVTQLVGNNSELAAQNILSTVVSIPSVALGILVGTLAVRGVRIVRGRRIFS